MTLPPFNYKRAVEGLAIDDFPAENPNVGLKRMEQLSMFNLRNKQHVKMGLFYELLTAGLFGGKLCDLPFQIREDRDDAPMNIRPDVMYERKGRIGESKACVMGHQLNLLDDQINRYRKYQETFPDAKIYFAIWRHKVHGIKKYKGTFKDLFKELGQKTIIGLVLPFKFIDEIHQSSKFRRYDDPEKWNVCTRISSSFLNQIFTRPEDAFKYLGRKQNGYMWHHFKTPEGFTINRIPVKSFPFLFMVERGLK